MAKVTINLDLSKDEDLRDYNLFNNSNNMFNALFEISYNLKKKVKYKLNEDENLEQFDLIFNSINEILEDNNIYLDKLQ